MAEKPEPIPQGSGRKSQDSGVGASSVAAGEGCDGRDSDRMMEAVVECENMIRSYTRVVGNKGCAGVDGMTVDELKAYLNDGHWERSYKIRFPEDGTRVTLARFEAIRKQP
jgi:RNA-directed DNA polymerase